MMSASAARQWPGPDARLLIVFMIAWWASGCIPAYKAYENPELGVYLNVPRQWDLEYYERSGSIVLWPSGRIPTGESARVEIYGSACNAAAYSVSPEQQLASRIASIGALYNLDHVRVINEATATELGANQVMFATIAIPTLSMPEDTARIRVGIPGPDVYQEIDIFDLRNSENRALLVLLYRGNDDVRNAAANKIISEIEIRCPDTP